MRRTEDTRQKAEDSCYSLKHKSEILISKSETISKFKNSNAQNKTLKMFGLLAGGEKDAPL